MKRALVCLLIMLGIGLFGCSQVQVEKATANVNNRTVITLASWLPTGIDEIVAEFNASQDDVHVELKTYYVKIPDANREYIETTRNQMHASFFAGDVPDLFYTVSIDAVKLRNGGLICDLYPIMQADSEFDMSQYRTDIWEQMEFKDALYELCTSYSLYGLGCTQEEFETVFQGRSGWTVQEYIDFLEANNHEINVSQNIMLAFLLNYGTFFDYIDLDALSCDFENVSFYEVLDLLNMCPAVEHSSVMINGRNVSGPYEHHRNALYEGFYYRYLGFPSAAADGPRVLPNDSFAISSTTTKVDACWTFLKWLLSYEVQTERYTTYSGSMPMRLDTWESSLEQSQYGAEHSNSLFFEHHIPGKNNEGELTLVPWPAMPIEEADYLRGIVAESVNVIPQHEDITAIVEEEVLAYLAGDKTAEECAHLIQERVSILLAEMR